MPAMGDDTGGFAGRLGATVTDSGDGTATLEFEATEEHLNPAGTVHGGVLATLVDTAMGTAIRSTTDDARIRTRGEHLTVCEADVDQDGRNLVHAVATFALLHD